MTENAVEDEHGSESYDPDLYVPTGEAEPVNGLEHVGDSEIERFKAQGFLAVEGAFSDAQMADAIKAVEDLIDGKIQGFRGVQFERGVRNQLAGASDGKRQTLVRKLQQWVGFDARLDSLARDARLLDVLGGMMGEPAKLYRHQAMQKPARIGREKPWPRTTSYFDLPMDTEIISVWIALQEAHRDNGCMHVIPGSHLEGP